MIKAVFWGLVIGVIFGLASLVHAAPEACDYNLDGSPAKWRELQPAAEMRQGGRVDKPLVGYFYRATCGGYDNFAVILIPPYELDPNQQQDESWVKLADKQGPTLFDMSSPTFVYLNGVEGWEGKIPVVNGPLYAHTLYGDGETAATIIPPTAVTLASMDGGLIDVSTPAWFLLPVAIFGLVTAYVLIRRWLL